MTKNHNLAKHILDAAWNKLVIYTIYEAGNAGRCIILVDPDNTSKKCSNYDISVHQDLSKRTYNCPLCSLSIDCDLMLLLIYSDWN
jgi:putative transposase